MTTPQQKIDKTRTFGGNSVEIRLVGDYFDRTLTAAQDFCRTAGAHFLSPFDDEDVIEGQATVAVEMLDQMDGVPDIVILPVGGGGLAAGLTSYFAEASPRTEFVYVEPQGAACLKAALGAGAPVTLKGINNFVDGAAVARIGVRTFERLKQLASGQVLLAPRIASASRCLNSSMSRGSFWNRPARCRSTFCPVWPSGSGASAWFA